MSVALAANRTTCSRVRSGQGRLQRSTAGRMDILSESAVSQTV